MLSSSIPLFAACQTAPLQKLWLEKSDSDGTVEAMHFFKMATTFSRENATDESLNSGAFGERGFCINILLRAATGYVCSPVAAKIICTQVCSTLVLLRLSRKVGYWSPSSNEMSDPVSFVLAKVDLLASATVYIIHPSLMKSAYAIFNAMSTLRSVTVRGSSLVISSRIFFVTCRRFIFLLRNNLFPPLMLSAIRESSKPFRLIRRSMWYDLRAEK